MQYNLPPLSNRLRPLLKKLATEEANLISSSRLSAPRLLNETTNLVEKTLIRLMEEIEKGPGSTRIW